MNILVENGSLSEIECGNNFSYLLNDTMLFSNTDYKILQSNENGPFIKCMKMKLNGKMQFFYLTAGLRSFGSMVSQMDPDTFVSVIGNVFYSINKVKTNGFLKIENLDLQMDHIFIDVITRDAYLLYLPLTKGMFVDGSMAENDFRSGVMKMILGISTLSSPKTMQLFANLQNATIPMEMVCDGLISFKQKEKIIEEPEKPGFASQNHKMKLVSVNMSDKTVLSIEKDIYIVGRSKKHADGVVIDDKKMVGRAHCRITKDEVGFWIEDLDSANGTYINKQKILAGNKCKIQNGDILKLANIEFKVQII